MNRSDLFRGTAVAMLAASWTGFAASHGLTLALILLIGPLALVVVAQWPRAAIGLVLLATVASPIFPRTLAARMVNYGLPLLVLGFWLLRIVQTRRDPRPLPTGLFLWFLAFIGWTLICSFFADNPAAGVAQTGRLTLLFLVLLAFRNHSSAHDLRRSLTLFMIISIPIAAYGVWEIFDFGLNPSSGPVRLASFYSNPNILGVAMGHCIVISFALLLFLGTRPPSVSRAWKMAGLLLALVLFLSALAGTISRASFLYAGTSMLVLAFCHQRLRWIAAGLGAATGLVLILIPPPAWLAIGFRLGAGDSFRTPLWKAGIGMMMDHPWTGVGSGAQTFETYRSHYLATAAHRGLLDTQAGAAHNVFLTKGAELGIPGLLLTLALFILFWSRVPEALRAYRNGDWLAGAAAAGMIGLSVRGLFESHNTILMAHVEDSILFFLFGLILLGRRELIGRDGGQVTAGVPGIPSR